MKRRICIITGSRAEYGLIYWLMKGIQESPVLELQILATGTHLSPEFGLTYKKIEQDGFYINKKVEMILSADTPSAIAKSTGLGMIAYADAFADLEPDFALILGDRYELFAAAFTALVSRIPILHIGGGESTEGAFDEAIRHSITKMAFLHFTAAEEYRERVIQLGEDPSCVYNVGSMGGDVIKKTKLLKKNILEKTLGLKFWAKNLMVTFHPVTLERNTSKKHFDELLMALELLKDTYIIFTAPNADTEGRVITKKIDNFVSKFPNRSIAYTSMGNINYLSTLQYVDAIVGNSSSGLSEAPLLGIKTINIGDRQKGRLKVSSIIDCEPCKDAILKIIHKIYSSESKKRINIKNHPFGDGNASEKILKILESIPIPKEPKKVFHNL